jgi:hypothetical protein
LVRLLPRKTLVLVLVQALVLVLVLVLEVRKQLVLLLRRLLLLLESSNGESHYASVRYIHDFQQYRGTYDP